jgi:hypothetical protein
MFTDARSCRKYEFIESQYADFSMNTIGIFAVKGRIVGNQLRATSVREVDGAASEKISEMLSKCSEKKNSETGGKHKEQ